MTVRQVSALGRRNLWLVAAAVIAALALILPSGISLASSGDDLRLAVFSTGKGCDTALGANGQAKGLVYSTAKLQIGANSKVNGTSRSHGNLTVGSNAYLNGPVHTNANLNVGANARHTDDGNATYVGSVKLGANTSTWDPIQVSPRTSLSSPLFFNLADYAPGGSKATAADQYHHHPSGLKVNSNKTLATGLHYVDGNVSLGSNVKGHVTIVATGKIEIGPNVALDPYIDQLGLMSGAGDGCTAVIKVSNNVEVGTVYAPNGGIQVGNNSTVDGAVVGERVTIGNNFKLLGAEVWEGELECGESTGPRQDGSVVGEIIRHDNADGSECDPKLFRLVPNENDEQHGSVVFEVFDPSEQSAAFFEAHLTFQEDLSSEPPMVGTLEYDPDGSDGYEDFKEMPACLEDPFGGSGEYFESGSPNPDAIPEGHEGCVISVTQHYDGTTNWHVVFMGDWKFR